MFFVYILSFICLLSIGHGDEPDWRKQVETILQDNEKWKRTVEHIMAQLALATFPQDFNPKFFASERAHNETLILNLQQTALRSQIYHRAISTMDDTITVPLPPGVTEKAARVIVGDLQKLGFPAFFMAKDNTVFMSKKSL